MQLDELGDELGQRRQPGARLLVQALEQRGDLGLEHAGHQPIGALVADLVQGVDRHGDGQAVARVAGLMQVGRRAIDAAQPDRLRERIAGDAGGLVPHQLVAAQVQQLGIGLAGLAVPLLQRRARVHVGRQLLVVEGVDQLVVDQHVLPARLVLQLLDLGDLLLVVRQEGQPRLPVAIDQRLADEDLARGGGVDAAEVHALVVVEHDAVERRALQRHDLRGLLLPVRLQQLGLDQVAGDARQPLRLDRRDAAAEQPCRVDQLRRDDPAARLLAQVRAGMAPELDAARAQVPVVVIGLDADIAQQARQHRQVDLLVGRGRAVQAPAVLGHHGVQLRVDVAPLAHAARADEVVAQQLFLLADRELVLPFPALGLAQPLPKLQIAHELRLLVVELLVLLVGLLLLLGRAVAHVLAGQGAGDDQDLAERVALAGLQDHAAHARVQREFGQLVAHGRELVALVDGAQLVEQLVAVGDGLARRRLDEGKVLDLAQMQRLHAQDHAGQRAAQDFRIGEARPAEEVLLLVEPHADAVADAAAAAGALVGGSLADVLDLQLLDLVAVAVALDARQARVDHVADAGHRQRGLGDVGRQHDARLAVRLEDAVLLLLGQTREQRQHLHAGRVMLAQRFGGLADLALAGQEDQHVTAPFAPELVDRVADGVVDVVLAGLLEGAIALLDREQPARDHQHRCGSLGRREVLREAVRIDGRRGHDDLQVGPARQDLAQVAEQEVDVEAAFVGLVDDQRVVGLEQRIGLGLGQQDAVGHQLDRGAGLQPVLEADLVADHVAQRRLELLGDAFGDAGGGDAARLGVADQAAAVAASAAHGQRDLGQLGGLAPAGLAADDHDLVLGERPHDLLAAAGDGQRFGELDRRDRVGGSGRPRSGLLARAARRTRGAVRLRSRRGGGVGVLTHGARIISRPASGSRSSGRWPSPLPLPLRGRGCKKERAPPGITPSPACGRGWG